VFQCKVWRNIILLISAHGRQAIADIEREKMIESFMPSRRRFGPCQFGTELLDFSYSFGSIKLKIC
jgi:hypothetical protein